MSKKIERNFLEISSLEELNESKIFFNGYTVDNVDSIDFNLNKFFYKNVGKNHHWNDRLGWTDQQWINYVSDKNVKTYILKNSNELAGFYELIINKDLNEIEIAYLGLLEEYQNKKLGSFLLSSAIKKSFLINIKRVWVHTCSLDHKNALNNYLSRGMKIFKKEIISI